MVGQPPVQLLGHRRVEAAQSGLDVGDRDRELCGRECCGDRRVDVAGDDDEVGLLALEETGDSAEDQRGLLGG